MVENDLPLVELAHVEAVVHLVTQVGPDILAVAPDIHGQEVDAVDAGPGQVVDAADEPVSLAVAPLGVTGAVVGLVGGVSVEALRLILSLPENVAVAVGTVEVGVAQQVLGAVDAGLYKVLAGLGPA